MVEKLVGGGLILCCTGGGMRAVEDLGSKGMRPEP